MRVSPTDRGVAFTAMLLFLWASALLLRDVLLALLAAAVSLAPVLDLAWLFPASRRLILEVRCMPVQEVWVWEKPGFEVVAGVLFEPVGLPEWMRLRGVEARGGTLLYRFEALFRYSGVYSLERLRAKVRSRLGLFELLDDVPVGVSFRVKPATLFWLQRALALLGVREGPGIHTLQEASPRVVYLRSTPEEYVGSREYQPGDDLRFIDWKATARRQALIIREFRGELGSQPLLALDLRCMGPYTCDAVASAVLSLAVGLASQGVRASGLYEADSGRLLSFSSSQGLLAYVVERVLESRVVDELDLYEFIEPPTLDEIRRVLREIAGLSIEPVVKARERVLAHGNIVYATALLHATSEVLDFASSVARSGGALSLIVPAEPWLDARDDITAERIKVSFHRAVRKLSSLGVSVLPCGEGAPRTLIVESSA